jgi:hypothetical protein
VDALPIQKPSAVNAAGAGVVVDVPSLPPPPHAVKTAAAANAVNRFIFFPVFVPPHDR